MVSIYSSGASDPGSLLESIEEAEKAGLIFSVTNSSNPGYEFSHELIRQAAIGTISPARRQRLHLEVADAIERIYAISPESPYAGTLDDYVADLAHHGQGGDRVKAVHCLRLAAQQAAQRSASSVAIDQLTNALRILKILPESPQRDRQELILQTRLGPLLIASKGNAADEVGMAVRSSRGTWTEGGRHYPPFPCVIRNAILPLLRADLRHARELEKQLLGLAEKIGDAGLSLEAHLAQGNTLPISGELKCGLESMERAFGMYDPQQHRAHALVYGLEPGVFRFARIG